MIVCETATDQFKGATSIVNGAAPAWVARMIRVADRPRKFPIDQVQIDEPQSGPIGHHEVAHGIVAIQKNTPSGRVESGVRRDD